MTCEDLSFFLWLERRIPPGVSPDLHVSTHPFVTRIRFLLNLKMALITEELHIILEAFERSQSMGANGVLMAHTGTQRLLTLLNRKANSHSPSYVASYGWRSSFSLYAVHFPILLLIVWMYAHPRLELTLASALTCTAVVALLILLGLFFSALTDAHTSRVRFIWIYDLVHSKTFAHSLPTDRSSDSSANTSWSVRLE